MNSNAARRAAPANQRRGGASPGRVHSLLSDARHARRACMAGVATMSGWEPSLVCNGCVDKPYTQGVHEEQLNEDMHLIYDSPGASTYCAAIGLTSMNDRTCTV